jgi:hypothetical protein
VRNATLRLLANGALDGVQVSVCSSDCRVLSRGASSRILSNFPGGASLKHPSPSHEPLRPQTSIIIASAHCPQAGTAVIRYSSFSTIQISFRTLSAHKSSILLSAPLLTRERIDLANNIDPDIAPRRRRTREISKSSHSRRAQPFPSRCKAARY